MDKKTAKNEDKSTFGKKVKVIFHNTKDDSGDVYVALNGVGYLVQREQEVEVPADVLGVIDLAVETQHSRGAKGEEIVKDIKRYPYTKVA